MSVQDREAVRELTAQIAHLTDVLREIYTASDEVVLEVAECECVPLTDEQIDAIADRAVEKMAEAMSAAIEREREAINREATGGYTVEDAIADVRNLSTEG